MASDSFGWEFKFHKLFNPLSAHNPADSHHKHNLTSWQVGRLLRLLHSFQSNKGLPVAVFAIFVLLCFLCILRQPYSDGLGLILFNILPRIIGRRNVTGSAGDCSVDQLTTRRISKYVLFACYREYYAMPTVGGRVLWFFSWLVGWIQH